MKQIIGANHRLARLEIALPIDETGEYAFDDNGKLLKNRKPVVLKLPRMDCITYLQIQQIVKNVRAVDELTNDDGEPLTQVEKQFHVELATLRPFVTDDEYALLETRPLTELQQITGEVNKESSVSLPELVASSSSSKSSARRSNTTSSESDSESEISATN